MIAQKPVIAITHGDLNGISYELMLRAFAEDPIFDLLIPVVYGSQAALQYYAALQDTDTSKWHLIQTPDQARPDRVNLIDCSTDNEAAALTVNPGVADVQTAGRSAFNALQRATADMLQYPLIDALVTCPINKAVMPADLFPYKGHTQYLADRFAPGTPPLMILYCNNLRVALLTTHTPIAQVSELVTTQRIIDTTVQLGQSLLQDFGIPRPRIAVLGLNPHAGDNGLIGGEEETVIRPAIEALQARKDMIVYGPFAADGFFGSDAYRKYDAVLAMYHDQGLAPFKALCMDNGVNFTAGLPVVRTSPDHGTGYDIAGQGKASYTSFTAALYGALDIVRNRNRYKEATANPLPLNHNDKDSFPKKEE